MNKILDFLWTVHPSAYLLIACWALAALAVAERDAQTYG